MIFLRKLPPAGDPVYLDSNRHNSARKSYFSLYESHFYNSGTAALAAALKAAADYLKKQNPEVVIPAYSCPKLVSAVQYAGAKPVLVDFQPERPWLGISQLQAKINWNTIAVVAVDLFGIPENISQLHTIIGNFDSLLIEDAAQVSPERINNDEVLADLMIFSFGRGKPVSLLGGGIVLINNKALTRFLPKPSHSLPPWVESIAFQVRARIYNLLSNPSCYWLVCKMPFLHLGETRFEPLSSIQPGNIAALKQLDSNLDIYLLRKNTIQSYISGVVRSLNPDQIVDLPKACGVTDNVRLVRYPILVRDSDLRQRLYEKLAKAGLGVSLMYPDVLPNIRGLVGLLGDPAAFPQAQAFAKRILTFPIHSGVRMQDMSKIEQLLVKYIN